MRSGTFFIFPFDLIKRPRRKETYMIEVAYLLLTDELRHLILCSTQFNSVYSV